MSLYYTPHRSKHRYRPDDNKPFKLNRSKIVVFLECPGSFYLDSRPGGGRPPGFPFNLNSAADTLLKQEFDGRLDFDVTLIPYKENDGWVENIIVEAHDCLNSDLIFDASDTCDYCDYREAAESVISASG